MRNPIADTTQIVRLLEALPIILAKGILSINDLTVSINQATAAMSALAEQLAETDQS